MIWTLLLVILGIALIVVFLNREKDEDKARMGIIGLTTTIVLLTIIRLIGLGGGPADVHYDVTADRSIGEIAADRIAAAATGKRVLIVANLGKNDPFAAARLEGFQQRLLTHSLEVIGVEHWRPQSALEAGESYPDEGMDARGVEEALRIHPDVEVLVSLSGFPGHNLDRIARQLEQVEFFVFDPYPAFDWQGSVAQGLVDGIVLPPADADFSETSVLGEELFERRYIFVTPENLAEMRSRLEVTY